MLTAKAVKGFTLIELLVVLVIMSLLLSLVPPLLSSVLPSVTIKSTANDLYQDIKYVRNMAVLKGRQTSISLNTLDGAYSSEFKDNGKKINLSTDIRITVKNVDLHESIDEIKLISFFTDGSSSGGVIVLSTDDQAYSIVIDWLTGRVSLIEGVQDEKV